MLRRIVILYSHPYPPRSHVGKVLLAAVQDLPFVTTRTLYDRYPDFAINVDAEREAITGADVLVWQSPLYWYGVPALMTLWFEKVLAYGWAYGPGGDALVGKRVLWVTTTGGSEAEYRPGAMHGHSFDAFVPGVSQIARYCGMAWEPPIVVHHARHLSASDLAGEAATYRDRLIQLSSTEKQALDG